MIDEQHGYEEEKPYKDEHGIWRGPGALKAFNAENQPEEVEKKTDPLVGGEPSGFKRLGSVSMGLLERAQRIMESLPEDTYVCWECKDVGWIFTEKDSKFCGKHLVSRRCVCWKLRVMAKKNEINQPKKQDDDLPPF